MKTMLGAVLAAAAIYTAVLAGTGRALPFGLPHSAAVWLVLGLGMTGCALGPLGEVATGGSWTSPFAVFGVVAGVIALAVVWASVSGSTLGIVADPRQWMFVLAGVIGVKVVVAVAHVLLAAGATVAARG